MASRKSLLKKIVPAAALLAASALFNAAHAVPALQLYLEGATYDVSTETWVTPVANGVSRLWVIATPGNQGPITDSKFVVAYGSGNGAGNVGVSVASSTTAGYGGFTDPSTPGTAIALGEDTSETSPLMNSGATLEKPSLSLPSHGIYGTGTYFQEFDIGDFTLTDSPTGDFISGFPSASLSADSQISVYEITIAGITTGSVHFDVYGTQNDKDVFAPFSHDAEAGTLTGGGGETPVPEPGQLAIFLFSLVGLGLARRRRKA